MPRYEFVCKDCKITLEVEQSLDAYRTPWCTHCGAMMTRCYSVPGISFKGPGFTRYAQRGIENPQSFTNGGLGDKKKYPYLNV